MATVLRRPRISKSMIKWRSHSAEIDPAVAYETIAGLGPAPLGTVLQTCPSVPKEPAFNTKARPTDLRL